MSLQTVSASAVNPALAAIDSSANALKPSFNLGPNNNEISYRVIRRDGTITDFDSQKIALALTKAFAATEGGTESSRIHQRVEQLTTSVSLAVTRHLSRGDSVHIETIQDQVELALMRAAEYKVARAYVLYREQRAQARSSEKSNEDSSNTTSGTVQVKDNNGTTISLSHEQIRLTLSHACQGLDGVDQEALLDETLRNLYDGISMTELGHALIMASRAHIEKDPDYSYAAARLLLNQLRHEAHDFIGLDENTGDNAYQEYFARFIKRGTELELLDKELLNYDLPRLAAALQADNDLKFTYLGLQTLYDRYFIHHQETRFELPQAFFMRVAMGLAINEIEREERAIEFYKLLSAFDFMSSTPTLFNSGTLRPQLSSCYLTTVPDELSGIFDSLRDNALLSKFAGGLGNDWTRVRAMGAYIKGTNGKSQGVVPFLKIVNDTAVAVNQGGKRKGAVCSYLESWHIDIEEFLELRKNTGDDRRRAHDMNTANWIPDLFMKRVIEEGQWTLFSPDETEDLHDLYGSEFETRYCEYEALAEQGKIALYKQINAVDLWRKMLTMLFETGHPWLTFKDPCNLRSPQQHCGIVHSSNLCTEITLNTSDQETAVCNLGSVNLARHLDESGELDMEKLERTITTAMRMLDNVIDYNYYSIPQARTSNLRHRPVGLGIMGFQDSLYQKRIRYASNDAVEFADRSMEAISYFTIKASAQLARERGKYPSYHGSLWSQGILPIDSINALTQSRGRYLEQDTSTTLDWDSLRQQVVDSGMRNSNCLAIAPTATIANICGVSASIEPTYQNLFVKSNLSGEFTIINPSLVNDLKERGLWDALMISDLKYYDGSLAQIDRVPDDLKQLYATAFETDPRWLIEAASRRQKWLDQSQSLNLYMANANGKKLDNLYKLAWMRGLKTTYYLRCLAATHVEKSTADDHRASTLNAVEKLDSILDPIKACAINDPECEACQ